MLIQNSGSAVSAQGLASDGAPVVVSTPQQPRAVPVEPAQAADKSAEQKQPAPTSAQVQAAVDNINRAMRQNNSNVEFSFDKETKEMVIKVVESQTGQVIRQFPSEEVLQISRAIDEMQQRGLLLKQKA